MGSMSDKTRLEMKRPPSRNLPTPQNNAPTSEEQPIASTVGHTETSTSVGEMLIVISQVNASTVSPEMVVSLPQVTSTPSTHRTTQNMIGDQRPLFPLSFTLRLSDREQPYYMSTDMMASLNPSASTCIDNEMAITSPTNP